MIGAYKIPDAEVFQIQEYPRVAAELLVMRKQLNSMPGTDKILIVISYFKDHRIKTALISDNEGFVKLITSGFLTSLHIEALFVASNANAAFTRDFEQFITATLSSTDA